MSSILKTFDAILNRFTMYKVVLYGLLALLIIADGLAFGGVISIAPVGLLLSTVVLGISCYVSNMLFARLWRTPANSESYLITALILACILPPSHSPSRLLLMTLCGVIAMASKYLIIWRGSHFLNPAAVGAFVLSVTGLLPATWWIATPYLAPFTTLLALAVLRKQRKFSLFLAFAFTALILLVYIATLRDQSITASLHDGLLSWPLIFMGSIILTEPTTLAATRYYQVLFGALVGAVFASQLRIGSVTATPQAALLAGNIATALALPAFGAMLVVRKVTKLAPDIVELAFERPTHRAFSYAPGQYMEWTLAHKGADIRGNRRMFSIASAPSEEDVLIAVRTYEPSSSYKRALTSLQPGTKIRVAHVAGSFTLPKDDKQPLLFIAGGIGITPFRSMVAQLLRDNQTRDVVLIYTARDQQHFAYATLFDRAVSLGLVTHYVEGQVSTAELQKLVPDLQTRQVYISGPDAMVSGYRAGVRKLGIASRQIHADHFTGY